MGVHGFAGMDVTVFVGSTLYSFFGMVTLVYVFERCGILSGWFRVAWVDEDHRGVRLATDVVCVVFTVGFDAYYFGRIYGDRAVDDAATVACI